MLHHMLNVAPNGFTSFSSNDLARDNYPILETTQDGRAHSSRVFSNRGDTATRRNMIPRRAMVAYFLGSFPHFGNLGNWQALTFHLVRDNRDGSQ
jgi:hypothetical protein